MSDTPSDRNKSKAQVDFQCLTDDCEGIVKFDLVDIAKNDFQTICSCCHRSYNFDNNLKAKLNKLLNLILAVREAEDILGDCNVAVQVPGNEVKIPYALLLTRLNTMITLNVGDKQVDFHFWIEPASAQTFR